MGIRPTISRQLQAVYDGSVVAGLSDLRLIERFTADRDETSMVAFAAIVARHGPMVTRVCRATLRDDHDA